VTVSGNTATIVARARMDELRSQTAGWRQLARRVPAADTIYKAKLSIGPSGTWLVTDMSGRFANGSGP